MNVGVGHGSSMGGAKRIASIQALEYLRSHGKMIPNTPNDAGLTSKFSTTGDVVIERKKAYSY